MRELSKYYTVMSFEEVMQRLEELSRELRGYGHRIRYEVQDGIVEFNFERFEDEDPEEGIPAGWAPIFTFHSPVEYVRDALRLFRFILKMFHQVEQLRIENNELESKVRSLETENEILRGELKSDDDTELIPPFL